jgi:hypothetical protein
LPRRHKKSAAGALAAALFLVAAPCAAQEASGAASNSETQTPAAPATVDAGLSEVSGAVESSGPLGGMGDEGDSQADSRARGGIGDQPTAEEEEVEVTQFGLRPEGDETRASIPGTQTLTRYTPFPPSRHDLDPYVPIGFRLGSFLLYTEAEIGTILADNVLATRNDTHSDIAFEFAPNRTGRAISSARISPRTEAGTRISPSRTTATTTPSFGAGST